MKRLLIILMIVLMVMGLSFGTAVAEDKGNCKQIANLAADMMMARQNGAPMYKQIEIVNSESESKELKQLLEMIIQDAYEIPRFSTQSHKKKAIDDFRNEIFLNCYRQFN